MHPISDTVFINILKGGVQRTSRFMRELTDFRGGPVKTEYVLTTDIAREFLAQKYGVRVNT